MAFVNIRTNVLWFRSVDAGSVYGTILGAQILLFTRLRRSWPRWPSRPRWCSWSATGRGSAPTRPGRSGGTATCASRSASGSG